MSDVHALLADSRLSPGARILGLVIALQEPGDDGFGPPLEFDAAQALLGCSRSRVRTSLRQLEVNGWVERRPGGRGHSDRFRIIGYSEAPSYADFRVALTRTLKDRMSVGSTLSVLGCAPDPPLSVRRREEEDDDEEVARARFSTSVHPMAEQVLDENAELFAGCRGALRDYLAQRVPRDKQHAYLRTVEMWLNGTRPVMKKPDGTNVPVEDRADLIAATMNDLAASDEKGMSRPVGDTGNARTKLRIMIDERYGTFSHGKPPATKKPARDFNDPSRYLEAS